MAAPDSMTYRLANVLYWLSILVGAAVTLLALAIIGAQAPIVHEPGVLKDALRNPIPLAAGIAIFFLPAIIGYGVGWSIRYVLTGRKGI